MRARQNITAVSNDSEYIAAYRKGMTVMKSRPDLDPTSWMYWVNIHWMVPEDMKNIRSQCEHGTDLFFPLRRAYIYFFEQVLLDATGLDGFNIPYWDWHTEPVLPLAFREDKNNNPCGIREVNR